MYLPTEEELREEIETQKAIFYLQQKDAKEKMEKNQMLKCIRFLFHLYYVGIAKSISASSKCNE